MKYTDRFFSFPMKVYDMSPTNERLLVLQGLPPAELQAEVDWVEGVVKLPYYIIKESRMFWYEGYTRGRSPREVAKEGSDLTVVVTKDHGDFVCTWDKKKFEEKLNQFIEKMEKWEQLQNIGKIDPGFFGEINYNAGTGGTPEL